MEYLLKEDIILINQRTVARHGGNFVPPNNFLNEGPLDYVIEGVKAEIFGQPLYPEMHHKAGLYMHNVISNHIFQDGNKRTGLGAALLFLRLNGYRLKDTLEKYKKSSISISRSGNRNSQILIEFTLEVASGKVSLEDCQEWFRMNMMTIPPKTIQ